MINAISSSSSFPEAARHLRLRGASSLQSASPSSSTSFPAFLTISAVRKEDESQTLITTAPTTAVTDRTTSSEVNKQTSPSAASSRHPNPPRRQRRQQDAPPRRKTSLPAILCNELDDLIRKYVDPAVLSPSVDPHLVLADNFAPVDELPPTPCPVVCGVIPRCLAGGAYIRNGPNPQHWPLGPYHLLDGDGMLHSLLLPEYNAGRGGTATFSSCYVRTHKYILERDAASPSCPTSSRFVALPG